MMDKSKWQESVPETNSIWVTYYINGKWSVPYVANRYDYLMHVLPWLDSEQQQYQKRYMAIHIPERPED